MLTPILRPIISSPLHGVFGPTLAPDGAILHWDASAGWQDQTGNQSLTLIGSAYPDVISAAAVNGADTAWGFDLSEGELRAALLAGEVVLTLNVRLPAMTEFTDATDYSIFGDVLFARVDSGAGSFKVSDGTNVATVAYDWDENEVVTVVATCFDDGVRTLMRVEVE